MLIWEFIHFFCPIYFHFLQACMYRANLSDKVADISDTQINAHTEIINGHLLFILQTNKTEFSCNVLHIICFNL